MPANTRQNVPGGSYCRRVENGQVLVVKALDVWRDCCLGAGATLTLSGFMLFGFINRVSAAASLRGALDVSAARTKAIGDRVAKASLNNGDGFALAATSAESPNGAQPGPPVDLEGEMVSLADEQLRYEATAKLLEKTYSTIRLSLRDR
jgi:hypothetical protein